MGSDETGTGKPSFFANASAKRTAAELVSRLRAARRRGNLPQGPADDPQDGGDDQEAAIRKPRRGRPAKERARQEPESGGTSGKRRSAGRTGPVVLDDIGNSFADLRERGGRSEAWSHLQSKIMRNLGTLVPSGAASLDVCVSLALKIEDFIKAEQAYGKSAPDIFEEWLRGGDDAKPS